MLDNQFVGSTSDFFNFSSHSTDTTSSSTSDLFQTIAGALPLEHVDVLNLELVAFSSPSSLLTLSGKMKTQYSFSGMPRLLSLKVAFLNDSTGVDFSPLCNSSLLEVIYSGYNFTQFSNLVNCLPEIQRAKFDNQLSFHFAVNAFNERLDAASLKYLYIYLVPINASHIDINCAGLEEFHFLSSPSMNLTFTDAPLKVLTISNSRHLVSSFPSFSLLESLNWKDTSGTPVLIPDLSFAPNLRSISMQYLNYLNSNLSDTLMSLPATIQSVELSNLAAVSYQTISFPSQWTSLQSLRVISLTGSQFEFDTNSILGLPSLIELAVAGPFFDDMESLYALPNLRSLSKQGNTIFKIPPSFFIRMSKLTVLNLAGQNFGGTIPYRGWENLEQVSLIGSTFTWPSIQGSASKLKSLKLSPWAIKMLPSDESFRQANLQSLRNLELDCAFSYAAMPFFWADLPNIETLRVQLGGYKGPLPASIAAPRLSQLNFARSTLCGPLPEFNVSTHLQMLSLRYNQLSGPIPQSWEENLSILGTLDLQNNMLNGTIPPNLLNHHNSYLRLISLSNNSFTGPFWNMSSGAPQFLEAKFTGMDSCSQDPDLRTDTHCSIDYVTTCTSRCPTFWDKCSGSQTCTERAYTPVLPQSACPSPVRSCPLPKPSDGFECNKGAWILLGNEMVSAITLPSSAGDVFVFGNLSMNGTITFTGTGTSIDVQECVVESPRQIVIELEEGVVPSTPVKLITQHGKNCTTDLTRIPVYLTSPGTGCKTWKVSTEYASSTLSAIFSLEDKCTKSATVGKSIIIGSSIAGGVVVLCLVAAALYWNSPGFRALIRTGSIRKAMVAK